MAQVTKITFSETELEAITQPGFFYTKHAALQKVMELLSETERAIRQIVLTQPQIGVHTNIESPKIFRGENYKLLPYMMLDYPRKFTTETVFAFRSMFWWGNEFSFTLHLQGEAWKFYSEAIIGQIGELKGSDFYCCVNKSPWQYHFEPDNYLPLEEILTNGKWLADLQAADFIKLSRKISVNDFQRVPEYAAETFALLLKILK
ncbi:hypothetical protein BH11BAC1_BH11BAC1_15960 [soil metagenome]